MHPSTRHRALKICRDAFPFLEKSAKKANMDVATQIYLHLDNLINDEWVYDRKANRELLEMIAAAKKSEKKQRRQIEDFLQELGRKDAVDRLTNVWVGTLVKDLVKQYKQEHPAGVVEEPSQQQKEKLLLRYDSVQDLLDRMADK